MLCLKLKMLGKCFNETKVLVGKVFQRNKSACWESFKDKGLSLKMEEIKSSRRVLKYLELLSTPTGLL